MSSELACCSVLPVSAISALTNSAKRCSMRSATLRSSAQRSGVDRRAHGTRSVHGAVDERSVRLGDRAVDGAVDGVDVLERASLAHELAPDEAGELAAGKGVRVDFAGHPVCASGLE